MNDDQVIAGGAWPYDVFISYSRRDMAVARKLHRELESYVPASQLGVDLRTPIVFRDETDLQGSQYYPAIDALLQGSRKLLVICSPNSRQSPYVADEIRRFASKRAPADVISILYAGKANNETPEQQQWAFPDVLVQFLGEPRALELRGFDPRLDEFDGGRWDATWYSLIADLFGLERRAVEDRERRRNEQARSQQAKELWNKANEAKGAGQWLEALHFLARAHDRAPAGSLKKNLSSAVFHARPAVTASAIWSGEHQIVGGKLSPGKTHLVAWDDHYRVLGFELEGGALLRDDVVHERDVQTAAFLTESKVATASFGGKMKMFDLVGRDEPQVFGPEGDVVFMVASATRPLVAALSHVGSGIAPVGERLKNAVSLWNWSTQSLVHEKLVSEPTVPFFCNGGRSLAFQNEGQLFMVHESGEGSELQLPPSARVVGFGKSSLLVFAEDGLAIIDFDEQGQTRVSPMKLDPEHVLRQQVVDARGVNVVGLTRDDRLVAIDARKRTLRELGHFPGTEAKGLRILNDCVVALDERHFLLDAGTVATASMGGELLWTARGETTSEPGLSSRVARLDQFAWRCEVFAGTPLERFIPSALQRNRRTETGTSTAATLGDDECVRFWKLATARASTPRAVYHQVAFQMLAFDKVRLGFVDDSGMMHVRDPFSGDVVGGPVEGVPELKSTLLNSDDTVMLGRAGEGRFARWKLSDEHARPEVMAFRVPIALSSVDLQFKRNAVLLRNGTLCMVRLADELEPEGIIEHASKGSMPAVGFQFSPDGALLTTWSHDGLVRVWNVETRTEVCSPIDVEGMSFGAMVDPKGARVVAWGSGTACVVKDLATGRETRLAHFGGGTILAPGFAVVRFSADGQLVFTAHSDRMVGVWDAGTDERILPFLEHRSQVRFLLPTYDDRVLLTSTGERICLWDLRIGRRAVKDIRMPSMVDTLTWARNEERWIGSDSGTIRVWDVNTALPVAEFRHPPEGRGDEITAIASSPDDRQLVSISRSGTARVWQLDADSSPVRATEVIEAATLSRYDADTFEVVPLTAGEFQERCGLDGWDVGERARGPSPRCAGLLSEAAVRQILRDENLFDSKMNPTLREAPSLAPCGDDVVHDMSRGLWWERSGSGGQLAAKDALSYVSELNRRNFGGFEDWRLPSLLEAMSLMTSTIEQEGLRLPDVFDRLQQWIWTSTFASPEAIWMVSYGWGTCSANDLRLTAFVRAVRG